MIGIFEDGCMPALIGCMLLGRSMFILLEYSSLFEEVVAKSKIIVRLSSSCCDAAELAIVKRNVKCLKQRIL